MPTEQEIFNRLRALHARLQAAYIKLQSSFLATARKDPTVAMDRHGLELVETQEALAWTGSLVEDPGNTDALVRCFENQMLRGDWTRRTACPMADCLSQMRFLARCKLIKRLREILSEECDGNL